MAIYVGASPYVRLLNPDRVKSINKTIYVGADPPRGEPLGYVIKPRWGYISFL